MKVHGANMLDNVKPETLEKVENYLVQSNGRLTYRTLILEIVPEILCLDLKQVSDRIGRCKLPALLSCKRKDTIS